MIDVVGLTKRYGNVTAVDDLSFHVDEGQLFAFLGRNGAGKSTAISCMTTILGFDAGTITLAGRQVGRDDHEIRGEFGVVFQNSVLDPILTVDENLALRGHFYGVPAARIDELVEKVGLTDFRDRRYGVLSGGERRRVDIARALLHSPNILFLDEPTTGLDPQSRRTVWQVLAELRNEAGLTIVLTTHYMEETEDADEVLIIDRGRALVQGTPIALRAEHSEPHLSLVTADPAVARRALARHLEEGEVIADDGGSVSAHVADTAAARAILDELGADLLDFEFRHGSMDDVFLSVTGGEA